MTEEQKITQKPRKNIKDKINHRMSCHYHKNFHLADNTHYTVTHIGELVLILLVGYMSWMFAGSVGLPNNTSFSYPVQQISTIECRTQYREEMDPGCKINLPKISNANYEAFVDSTVYRQTYTTLRAAPYKDSRNQNIGAHAGVDIATARGTPLFSIGDGQVTYAGRQNGYGNVVKVKYLFHGTYIHAIYAHMDTIEVEAGNNISAGSRVGTAGNSGNTFGALGGFHVHLEINKDSGGRPMYAYLNCPDLSKGHSKIIQEGLCRDELLSNQYDPIVLFERNTLGNVIKDMDEQERADDQPEDTIEVPTEVIDTHKENDKKQETPKLNEEHSSPSIPEEIVDVIEQNNNREEDMLPEKEEQEEEKVIIPEIIDQKDIITDIQTEPETINPQISVGTGRIGEKVEIDTTDLSEEVVHFFNTHDLYINNHTGTNTLQIGEKKIIEMSFYPKGSNNKFVGILPFALDIIPSQTNIITDYSSIQLISPNPTTLTIQGQSNGTSVLIVSIDNITILKIAFSVN